MTDADRDRLRASSWDDRKVLVFRDAQLTPDQQVEAVRIFDEPFDHPTADAPPRQPRSSTRTRSARRARPAAGTSAGCGATRCSASSRSCTRSCPDIGGDTIWADLQAAYDDLSEPFKELVGSVGAVYDANADHYAQGATRATASATTTEHPLVLDPPAHRAQGPVPQHVRRSGSPASPRARARRCCDYLIDHASAPQYQVRFGWDAGDFVLWDNQATWHYAVDDYGDAPRAYRKVIAVAAPA